MNRHTWEEALLLFLFQCFLDYWYIFLIVFIILIFLCRNKPCPGCGSKKLSLHGQAAIRVNKAKGGAASPMHNYRCADCGLFYDPGTGLADDPQPKQIVITQKGGGVTCGFLC